jgi:hypothetical protein
MQRLKDYARFLVWSSGLGYIALWGLTMWTLDHGPAVFGRSGVCRPLTAQALFYWTCDADSALSLLATLANAALTITVWAPVYVAAATALPAAVPLAAPIILAHVIGLPAALLVLIRVMVLAFALVRRFSRFILTRGHPSRA